MKLLTIAATLGPHIFARAFDLDANGSGGLILQRLLAEAEDSSSSSNSGQCEEQ